MAENSDINNLLENYQLFENKIDKDKEKFSLTHAFNKIDSFSKKNLKKIMIGGAIVLSMGVGAFGATAYHYAEEMEKISAEAERLLSGQKSEIQHFLNQKDFQDLQSKNNVYIPFDENFYHTLKQNYNSDKEVVIQSPFVSEQKIYFYTRESFRSNKQFDFYENFEKQDAIKMSENRAFAYNSERAGHNLTDSEYSKHYIVVDENVPVDFTDYEDLKDFFIIIHEAAHTHFIQELNVLNPNFEKHEQQINESNSDITAVVSTAKYFDLDYLTFQEVFSGLLSMRIEDAKENKKNGHNTAEALEYILELDENEYNQIKKMNYSDIPFFANDLVLNLGLSNYLHFDRETLVSKIKDYDTSSLNDENFNHLMLNIRTVLKNEDNINYEQYDADISQHIQSFRSLNSQKSFMEFIESDKAPESLKRSHDIEEAKKSFEEEKSSFETSLASFLKKVLNKIDNVYTEELEIPESIKLGSNGDKNTFLNDLRKRYKIN